MPQLLDSKSVNVVSTNVERDEDGILRKVPPFIQYKNDFYPYLALKAGVDFLLPDNKQFFIDNNKNLIITDRKVPLTKEGMTIVNWYKGFNETNGIPLYKILNEAQSNYKNDYKFHDTFVFVVTTANALYDI